MANDEYSSCIHQWALRGSSLKAKFQLLLIPIRPVTSVFLASISSFTRMIFVCNWQLRPFNVYFNKVQLFKFPFSSSNEIYHRILLKVTLTHWQTSPITQHFHEHPYANAYDSQSLGHKGLILFQLIQFKYSCSSLMSLTRKVFFLTRYLGAFLHRFTVINISVKVACKIFVVFWQCLKTTEAPTTTEKACVLTISNKPTLNDLIQYCKVWCQCPWDAPVVWQTCGVNRGACFEYLQMLGPLQCFGTVLVSSMIA